LATPLDTARSALPAGVALSTTDFDLASPSGTRRRALEFDVLDQFHYVEGFVLDGSETVPHPHAWLSAIANDAVVDFTGPRAR